MQQIETDTGNRGIQLLAVHEITALLKVSALIRANDLTYLQSYRLAGERAVRDRVDQLEFWKASRLVESDEVC